MNDSFAVLTRSVSLFVLAGLCEIGGGWLIWKWLRDGRPGWWGLIGGGLSESDFIMAAKINQLPVVLKTP